MGIVARGRGSSNIIYGCNCQKCENKKKKEKEKTEIKQEKCDKLDIQRSIPTPRNNLQKTKHPPSCFMQCLTTTNNNSNNKLCHNHNNNHNDHNNHNNNNNNNNNYNYNHGINNTQMINHTLPENNKKNENTTANNQYYLNHLFSQPKDKKRNFSEIDTGAIDLQSNEPFYKKAKVHVNTNTAATKTTSTCHRPAVSQPIKKMTPEYNR